MNEQFHPVWIELDGIFVLSAPGTNLIAVGSGKKTQKAGKMSVIDCATKEVVVPSMKFSEVTHWLFRSAKAAADKIEFDAEQRKYRLLRAQEYIRTRSQRAPRAKQLELF